MNLLFFSSLARIMWSCSASKRSIWRAKTVSTPSKFWTWKCQKAITKLIWLIYTAIICISGWCMWIDSHIFDVNLPTLKCSNCNNNMRKKKLGRKMFNIMPLLITVTKSDQYQWNIGAHLATMPLKWYQMDMNVEYVFSDQCLYSIELFVCLFLICHCHFLQLFPGLFIHLLFVQVSIIRLFFNLYFILISWAIEEITHDYMKLNSRYLSSVHLICGTYCVLEQHCVLTMSNSFV